MSKKISFVLVIIIMLNVLMSVFSNVYATQETQKHLTFKEISASEEVAEDTISAYDSVNSMIGAILTVTQVLGVLIAIIAIGIALLKHLDLHIKLSRLYSSKEETEEIEREREEIKIKIKQHRNKILIVVIVGIILFAASGILSIIKSFKPIIYLYPEEEQEVSVELGYPEYLTCTYPKYENSWEVIAEPNGDLTDIKTGRKLYALYWEGQDIGIREKITEGFCVKGEDSAKFLEEKLAILGLTEREAEEFIVYWLPELEQNKYNLIRFETMEEIERDMPLNIIPTPDTVIRVMMQFEKSNKYVELPEQVLETPERKGFVVVEWGGQK